ncbi:MAG: hypothetical protein ACTSQ1_04945 [Promethearchaeota archaeon]
MADKYKKKSNGMQLLLAGKTYSWRNKLRAKIETFETFHYRIENRNIPLQDRKSKFSNIIMIFTYKNFTIHSLILQSFYLNIQ